MIYCFLKFVIMPIYVLLRIPRVIGLRNAQVKGGAIVICNHVSQADPFRIALLIPRFVHFMAKSELFEKPLLKWILYSLLAFPINRNTPDLKAIKRAAELLKKGKVFGIFPEGTRSVIGDVDKIEKGAAFIAVQAQVPIIPMFIPYNSYGLFRRPTLYIGEPIHTISECSGLSASRSVKHINELSEIALRKLKASCEGGVV